MISNCHISYFSSLFLYYSYILKIVWEIGYIFGFKWNYYYYFQDTCIA